MSTPLLLRGSHITPAFQRGLLTAIAAVVGNESIKSATYYQGPDRSIVATRRGKPDGRVPHLEILLTVGKPNFRGRAFVKACLKAGEPFPVRKVQVKWMKGKRP